MGALSPKQQDFRQYVLRPQKGPKRPKPSATLYEPYGGKTSSPGGKYIFVPLTPFPAL